MVSMNFSQFGGEQMGKVMSLVGLLVLVGIAFALSNNKKKIKWRTVIVGVSLKLLFAALILNKD